MSTRALEAEEGAVIPFALHWARPCKPQPELTGEYDPVAQRWSAPDETSASTFSRTGTTDFGKDPDEDRDD